MKRPVNEVDIRKYYQIPVTGNHIVRVGSWVRFVKDDVLCLSIVRYIYSTTVPGLEYIITDVGEISADMILEVRNA